LFALEFSQALVPEQTRRGSLGGSIRELNPMAQSGGESTLMVGYSQLRQRPDLKTADVVRRR
jgi:hypothetical protein